MVAPFRLHLGQCRPVVAPFRHHQVAEYLLVALAPVAPASVLVLALVLVVPASVLVLVAHAPVVLAHVLAVPVLDPAALVHVLVLVLALVVQVLAHAQVARLVPALTQAVHVLAAALVAVPAVHVMVSVVHLARSRVHVEGASSMNCSRSSLATPTAMHQCPRAPSSLSVVGQHRSSLQN